MAKAKGSNFDQRVGRIVRHHKSLQRGTVTHIGHDGLLTVRPRRTSMRFPWRGVIMSLILLVVSKATLYAHMGAEAYLAKLEDLRVGNGVEQFGAWLMTPDVSTQALAAYITPFL